MNKKILLIAISFVFALSYSIAQLPSTFLVKPERLVEVKDKFKKGNPKVKTWMNSLLKTANKELELKPVSVMMKKKSPPSGSKHDYMSLAPYYWPDSSKPNQFPYIRKDGQHNPEIYGITDHQYVQELERWVQDLALAYYFTDEEKYAAKASAFLHVWFLDTATLMNPNLNYAQAILGVNEGRGTGIIDVHGFPNILNMVGLLNGSKSWSVADESKLKVWFEQYLNWLIESKNGLNEYGAKNNHGTWYNQQVESIAFYLGKNELAKKYLNNSLTRLAVQIEPDGRQPLELVRTNAISYSSFNIEAWYATAALADNLKMDFWNYTTTDGRSFKKAFDWLLPYAMGEKKWEYQQISEFKKKILYRLLLQSANHYGDNYYQIVTKMNDSESNIADIFYNKLNN